MKLSALQIGVLFLQFLPVIDRIKEIRAGCPGMTKGRLSMMFNRFNKKKDEAAAPSPDMFRWCFVGTGTLALQVAEEITKTGRHAVTAVCSRRFESAEIFAKKYGAEAYHDLNEALAFGQVDGVYVVTPHSSHYEYTKAAIEAGVPVLCEKPFSTDAKKTRELFALARKKKVYAAEAMWTWFSPVAHKVKQWLDDGEFGKISKVSLSYHMNFYRNLDRLTNPEKAGGALLDIGIYPVTYIYRLFGRPKKVICRGKVVDGIDRGEEIFLQYPDGMVCHATVSMEDLRGLERLEISGTKASIRQFMFHYADKVKLVRKKGRNELFCGDGSYTNEFDCAAAEIREGLTESILVPPKATKDVMVILDECRRQMGVVYPFDEQR